MNSFETLCRRYGAYSLPYLIHIHNEDNSYSMRFVNNLQNVTYDGHTYIAAGFSYTPNQSENGFNGGGSLEIGIKDTLLVDLVESSDNVTLEVIAAISNTLQIVPLTNVMHHYGKANGDRTKISFEFNRDDRAEMTFPALIWDTLNNRGNS